jgi:uncharacterized protein (TIGR02421 family)
MDKLSIREIINHIQKGEKFEAQALDASFRIKVSNYVPFICTAIHNGSNMRNELKLKCELDEYHRWYEEDPHTGQFIESMPITLIANDSRFEYDLNRKPEDCIYEEAWGKKIWKKKLNPKDRQIALKKHSNFYRVLKALVERINKQFSTCVVYDIHSYNHQRWEREVPLFNIGTERLDQEKFGSYINLWQEELSKIKVSGIENKCSINDVFHGRGYALEFITHHFPQVLVLATEIKKVYCNELTGEDYPARIRELMQGIKNAILRHALTYSQKESSFSTQRKAHLLGQSEDKDLLSIDRKLHRILKNFEILAIVNPINSAQEYKRFVKNKFTETPKFKYSPIKINPFELKQKLSALPTSQISDISFRTLYETVINSYFDKIDMIASINSKKFLYNSLRYFGRPDKTDLINAEYILHLPIIPSEPRRSPTLDKQRVLDIFNAGAKSYDFNCNINLSSKVISRVLVLNSKRTILIRPDARFSLKEAQALVEHEIGVHMLTTQNSGLNKLKVFNLGLPVNTMTQEGLAILAEFLSGNITLSRLKKLALRVVVTDMMCNGASFIDCYKYLVDNHHIGSNDAYTITTRIFRGGGFTKDHLYLKGFVKILNKWNAGQDLSPLLVGKTSIEFYDTIQEMIDRGLVSQPQSITHSLLRPNDGANDSIYSYIISGLI